MKKRAKLTQEQLKAVLQGWKTTLLACCVWDIGDYFSDEHVYTQIEELIEDSDTAAWMDRCHELEMEKHELGMEVAELRKGLTVTKEWVTQKAKALRYQRKEFATIFLTNGLMEMLKELGVTVETTH